MRTLYMVWHQAAGMVHEFVFDAEPTALQLHALHSHLRAKHGRANMAMSVRTVTLLEGGEVPSLPKAQSEAASMDGAVIEAPRPKLHGHGFVSFPETDEPNGAIEEPERETMTIGAADVGTIDLAALKENDQ